ncbi:MAG: proteic killer suppression protein [Ignavibacteria bacterium]|nr:MAG: proteic killer suppression protein [Ignavibacteria bacterium]KAF0155201.1 MAG: proteic killer suppression protein [Ignavibacteria bacterium]
MIKSFADKTTAQIFERNMVRGFPLELIRTAYRKFLLIDAAGNINDLRIPPGNKLEKLSGKLADKHSIKINDQWRIVFKWFENDAYEVQILDYHKG